LSKGIPLHLNNLEFPHPKNNLCQVWLKLAQSDSGSREEVENVKVYRQTDNQNSSLEHSAQVS
jgi:hypothetical protein